VRRRQHRGGLAGLMHPCAVGAGATPWTTPTQEASPPPCRQRGRQSSICVGLNLLETLNCQGLYGRGAIGQWL
jgi:hypothetical protein